MGRSSRTRSRTEDNHSPEVLEKLLAYRFRDGQLLLEALTHASFSNENGLGYCNERLEFLGDAVLELCVSEILYKRFPEATEGELSARRASIVCEDTLSAWAIKVGIPSFLRLGRGLCMSGGREQPVLSADAAEAVFGAVFIDGGFEAARSVIEQFLLNFVELEAPVPRNPKADLQELMEKRGLGKPDYEVTEQVGPPHAPVFRVKVTSLGEILGTGNGRTIREAERKAAEKALEQLCRK